MRMRSSLKNSWHQLSSIKFNADIMVSTGSDRHQYRYRTKMVLDGYGDGGFHDDPLSEWEYFHIHNDLNFFSL